MPCRRTPARRARRRAKAGAGGSWGSCGYDLRVLLGARGARQRVQFERTPDFATREGEIPADVVGRYLPKGLRRLFATALTVPRPGGFDNGSASESGVHVPERHVLLADYGTAQ